MPLKFAESMPEKQKQQLACRTAGLAQENLWPNERLWQIVVFGVEGNGRCRLPMSGGFPLYLATAQRCRIAPH